MYDLIKKLLEEKGTTCSAMCKETGLKQNTISNLKSRPNSGISLDTAIKLSKYFDVPVETFEKKGE